MNIKDIVIPLFFAVAITLAMQYFFGPKVQELNQQQAGQRQSVPTTPQTFKPLAVDVEFEDTTPQPEQVTELITSYGHLEFSSFGGCLKDVTYNRTVDHKNIELTTLVPAPDYERWKNCFLVALNESTPYFYSLTDQLEEADATKLEYQATTHSAKIIKTFTVYKNSYRIDMALTVLPRQSVQARIMYPTPLLQGSSKAEHIAGVIEEQDAALTKYPLSRNRRDLQESYWLLPRIFGAEDRYFAHVLYKDQNHFAQRGYYRVDGDFISAIVEGPEINKETSWNLSFYVGPKEHEALVAVDERLEQLLDYGWLAFLCKPLLHIMKWLKGYVHNFGLVIIILTLMIRLLLLPLTIRGTEGAKKAQEMQKKLQYIKQKYKDDPEAYEREQAELYKKYGLGGLGGLLGGGCMPLLLQMPVFFAMNRVLSSSIELYQAPFLWISDLSAKDPYYIFPILVAISMLLSTFTISEKQQRISSIMMAIVFGAFSVGFSAGLSLYIFASTLFASVQMYIQKVIKNA